MIMPTQSQTGRYFQEKLIAADSVLDLITKRFTIGSGDGPERIYYWLIEVEREAKRIGMSFYSRRGRKTLIGHLQTNRLWLRSKVYEFSVLTLSDLLDSNGRLIPQHANDRVIDFEHLLDDIARETVILRDVIQEFNEKEARLIREFKRVASEKIGRIANEDKP